MTFNNPRRPQRLGDSFGGPLTAAFFGSSTMQRFIGTKASDGSQIANPRNNSMFTWAMAHMGCPFRIVGGLGTDSVTWESHTENSLRVLRTLNQPQVVFVYLGLNDSNESTLSSVSSRLGYLRAFLEEVRKWGGVVVTTTLPSHNFVSTAAEANWASDYNAKILMAQEQSPNLIVVDINGVVGDHSGTYSVMSATYGDATHFNQTGSQIIGREIARQLKLYGYPFVPRPFFSQVKGATGQFTMNPFYWGTGGTHGGGSTGTLAAGITTFLAGTNLAAATSLVARTDLIGANWQRVEFTQTGAPVLGTARIAVRRANAALPSAFAVGDWVELLGEVRYPNAVSGAEGAGNFKLEAVSATTTQTTRFSENTDLTAAHVEHDAGTILQVRTAPFKLLNEQYRFDMIQYVVGTDAAFSVDFGRIALRKIDDPTVIL